MSTTATSTQIHLASRPVGWPVAENFSTEKVELPALEPGEIRVRNEFVSVDPYMRGRMNDGDSYVPPFGLGAPLDGGAVGRVVESADDSVAVGAVVTHMQGWRDLAQGPAAGFAVVPDLEGIDLSAYLGVLGMPGLTAYVGLLDIAGFSAGDAVFVSGAAGAVGSLVGQIARVKGASRVVGSAGSASKVETLIGRYGFDAAFNYKDGPVADLLAPVAPDGIDVYFDNVGGEHLEAAIGALRQHGRVALCGSIVDYNSTTPPVGPRNLPLAIGKGLRLQGFIVSNHVDRQPQFIADMTEWIKDGHVSFDETVVTGVENTPAAFLAMMRGENTGKMVVDVR